MDTHAYHTLQILDHVEKSPIVTNRKVATKLDVSVKLAHTLLKQLVHKGLLHISKRNARRWDYFLTPQGIAEKARLMLEFMDFTLQFYREARARSASVLLNLHSQGVREIALLGLTELSEIAYLGAQEHKLTLIDVFDDQQAGKEFMGIRVRPTADMPQSRAEKILVTAFDPALPMRERFLPPDLTASASVDGSSGDTRFVWVFGENATPAPPTVAAAAPQANPPIENPQESAPPKT